MDARRWRLAGLGILGILLAAWSSYGPFLWATCCHPSVTPLNQGWILASQLAWVGLLLAAYARDPAGPMWRLVLLYLAFWGSWVIGYISTDANVWDVALTLQRQIVRWVYAAVLVHIALAFPNGQLRASFDRYFVRFLYGYVLGLTLSHALVYDSLAAGETVRNVAMVWPNNALADSIERVGYASVPVLAAVAVWRLWRRWAVATPAGRRPLTPVLIALPTSLAILSVDRIAFVANQVWLVDAIDHLAVLHLTGLILPGGFLIGLLRARLARGKIADLALELSAGVPLGGLEPVLRRVLRDPTLELLFPAPDGDGFVHADGRRSAVPAADDGRMATTLRREAEVLALLIHDVDLEAEDPDHVKAVASVAELALANERLSAQVRAQLAEVRASRARIVEAADTERRRIERDLHDGAQQRLLALATRLQTAKATTDGAGALVEEATAELQAAVTEVRELARGLHPPILTDLGLGPALDALAERATIPVRVRAPQRRYPQSVESAAYFVVSEALTNIARHARATAASVTITDDDGELMIAVDDDGRGGVDMRRGSGLRGLADRVAALGGSLTIDSPAGEGTALRASFPL